MYSVQLRLKLTHVFILLYYRIIFKLYVYDVRVCVRLMLTHVFIMLYCYKLLLYFSCAGWRSADANVFIMLNLL
jgi:hypothetical protein